MLDFYESQLRVPASSLNFPDEKQCTKHFIDFVFAHLYEVADGDSSAVRAILKLLVGCAVQVQQFSNIFASIYIYFPLFSELTPHV